MSTALVTGASSGIGAAYARRLAADGFDLVLAARRVDRLTALAAEVHDRWRASAEVVPIDLVDAAQVDRLVARTAELADLGFLVNAAGFVTAGRFVDVPVERHRLMLQVHVEALLRLCRAAVPGMLARGGGAVVNVASIGALVPSAGNVTYSGSKAFLVTFSRALADEVRASGLRIQALCPGFTRTGIYETEDLRGLGIAGQVPGWLWMSAEEVVDASLRALTRDTVVCVPGWQNRLLLLGARLGLSPFMSAFTMRVTRATRGARRALDSSDVNRRG